MSERTFYFSDGPYLQAIQGLYGALSMPEAFIKFVGQPQTGKSSVCEKLTLLLQHKDYQVVYFNYPIESPEMLREMLATELDFPPAANFARQLEDILLLDSDKSDKPIVVIFDDAHLLTDITLIEIYRLAEIQINRKRVVNIVLCGEPSLEKRLLNKDELKSLLLSVSHNFILPTMDAETSSHFLLSYFEKAGLPGLQLEAAALSHFTRSCRGLPGTARTICGLILNSRRGQAELTTVSKSELIGLIKNARMSCPYRASNIGTIINGWF